MGTLSRVAIVLLLSVGTALTAKTEETTPTAEIPIEEVWRDVSTTEDGISPTQCTDTKKHCIFEALPTRQFWTSVTLKDATSGLGELKDQESAVEACKSIQNWGGFDDWRLPSISEISYINVWLKFLVDKLNKVAGGENAKWDDGSYFWTATRIYPHARMPLEEQDPEKAWAFSFINPLRSIDRNAPLTWLCTRNNMTKFWDDKSTLADGTTPTKCSEDSDLCMFEDKRTGLLWTEISPGEDDRDADSDHLATVDELDSKCKSLKWAGGHMGFRAPKLKELEKAHHNGIHALSQQYEFFGVKNTIWSSTSNYFYDCYGSQRQFAFNITNSKSGDYHALGETHPNAVPICPLGTAGRRGEEKKLPWVCIKSVNDPLVPPPPPPPPPPDDDGDGVPNSEDKCSNSPKGSKVWKAGDFTKDGKPIDPKFIGCARGEVPDGFVKPKPPGKSYSREPYYVPSYGWSER